MQQYFSEDNLSNVFRNKSPAAVAGGAVEYFMQGLKAGKIGIWLCSRCFRSRGKFNT